MRFTSCREALIILLLADEIEHLEELGLTLVPVTRGAERTMTNGAVVVRRGGRPWAALRTPEVYPPEPSVGGPGGPGGVFAQLEGMDARKR